MPITTDAVTIGRVLKPFGVKGEVRVESLTDVPGRFEDHPAVSLVSTTGQILQTTITHARPAGPYYLLKFADFSSPEEIAAFRGALIQMPPGTTVPALENHYYQFELIGLEVRDESNQTLGHVEEVLELPHHAVFVVRQKNEEFLIPAIRQVIKDVDVSHGTMTVSAIEQWGVTNAV